MGRRGLRGALARGCWLPLLYAAPDSPAMRLVYVPTVTCKGCSRQIQFSATPHAPEHLHLRKTSFVTVCPNPRCKRLVTADPGEVEWRKKDLDDAAEERLPF